METLRIKYTKTGYMKFLGHLELMKLFERIFRFEKLPLKYSEGFNPIPKLTFAAPLSVGYSSQGEVMEVQLTEKVDIDQIIKIKFPNGIDILEAKYVNCKKSLMAALESAEYIIKLKCNTSIESYPLKTWVKDFLKEEQVTYDKKTKKGLIKQINVLDQLNDLELLIQNQDEIILKGNFQSGSQGSLNPETLVKVFAKHFDFEDALEDVFIERHKLLYLKDAKYTDLFLLEDEA